VITYHDGRAVHGDLDRRAAVAVRVDDEVGDDPVEAARIRPGHGGAGEHHLESRPRRRLPDDLGQRHESEIGVLRTRVQPGDLQQVLDQRPHTVPYELGGLALRRQTGGGGQTHQRSAL
jgi:hypothetical protein